ncbi:MAG TPA: DnaA/Hda family protein [Lacipirellulaceae bacterium]|nr:DnaA/Hda family protein [Lacipirellulaceae bacterium]
MDDSDRLSVLRDALRRRIGSDRYELWLGDRTHLELTGHTLRVECGSAAELQWLRRRLQPVLAECCTALWSPAPAITFVEAPPTAPQMPATIAVASRQGAAPTAANGTTASPPEWRRTFDNFAVGACNLRAAHVARELAAHPGRFSPLLLHGPAGCGKSHLLDAVAAAAREARGRVRTVLISAEQFTAQFLDALHRRSLPSFRHKTRSVDLLLLDDVQFLSNKNATLEELLHTIDDLHARRGQVVFTSSCSVGELQAISPELAARIGAGLAVGMEQPDFATRLAIVRQAAPRLQLPLDEISAEMIAREVVGSARLISGALNRLAAAALAEGTPLSSELAEREVAAFCRDHAMQVRLADIQRAMCEEFDVEPTLLRSQRRTRAASDSRMLCMWLARRYTRAALSEIGDFFGGRRHSTVVSAKRKVDELISRGGDVTLGDRSCGVEEAVRRVEARLRIG